MKAGRRRSGDRANVGDDRAPHPRGARARTALALLLCAASVTADESPPTLAVRPAPPVAAGPAPESVPADAIDGALRVVAKSLARLDGERSSLWLADLDGDGDQDLVSVSASALLVWRMGAERTYPQAPDARLPWPGDDVGWDLADLDADGATEVLVIEGGQRLVRWNLDATGSFGEPILLADALGAALPRGIHRVPFARDVDGIPPLDLVIPGPGRFRILRATTDGLAAPIDVAFESKVEYSVGDPTRLDTRFGQDVTIPWFRMRDIDGDGRLDLVSETRDRVLFHLADPELPAEPTWRLDLEALRAEVRLDEIDFFNLTRNMNALVTWRIEDLDGKPPADLVIQQGGTLLIWLGGSRGGIDRAPDDVLPSSGNVLLPLFFDIVGDPLPELHLLRIEDITLGEVVRMAVMDSTTTLEVYSYRNLGGTFERKAMRVVQIDVELPSLLDLDDEQSEARLGVLVDVGEAGAPEAHRACLDADGRFDDVVAHDGGRVRFWRDAASTDPFADDRATGRESLIDAVEAAHLDGLADFLRRREDDRRDDVVRQHYDVTIADLAAGAAGVASLLRGVPRDRQAVLEESSVFGEHSPDVIVADLDGDGISDVLLVHALTFEEDGPSLRSVQAIVLGTSPAGDD